MYLRFWSGAIAPAPSGSPGVLRHPTVAAAATTIAVATTTVVERFLVYIMSEMEISFYWAKSCMFRDLISVFWVEWWGKPLELEQQSEQ
jgi:hypothetical protein